MSTYIILLRFTPKGIESIKKSPSRLDAARKKFADAGAQINEFYLVTGQYDAVLVAEAPDEETITRLALGVSSRGNVHTETLRAFPEAEYRKIIADLP